MMLDSAAEYESRVNRAIDFIERNLASKPSLEEIARVAGFSSFHFHRLFSARAGETLGQFTSRLRLERAAARLLDRTHERITEVALDLGFTSPASFARAFRGHFGVSATEWRERGRGRRSNARPSEVRTSVRPPPEVRIDDWEIVSVAYVRHVGAYAGDEQLFGDLIARLLRWAEPRGLVTPEARLVGVYHDPPGITSDERLRLSIGLTLEDDDVPTGGEVQLLRLDAGRWAIAPFELAPSEYAEAWARVYAGWLPDSGYQPAHRPALEIYREDRRGTRPGARHVEICVPIEPLVGA